MINVLFAAGDGQYQTYAPHLENAFAAAGLDVALSPDHAAPDVDYIVYAPSNDLQDFTEFTNCKAVLSLWAGVERIVDNNTLTQNLCRMVDEGLTQGMVEWVTAHVLFHHLELARQVTNPQKEWVDTPPPLARNRRVTILGLGALGQACADALVQLGFQVSGWSRREKQLPEVTCHHGEAGLMSALQTADILVLLLPQTARTQNILNAETLAMLPKGAAILNPGRGTLIDDDALIAALDAGHIEAATLDVFRIEPLPQKHPYWDHPKVIVTPHIASATRPDTAARVIAENVRRGQAGEALLHLVDRDAGY